MKLQRIDSGMPYGFQVSEMYSLDAPILTIRRKFRLFLQLFIDLYEINYIYESRERQGKI